MQLLIIDDEKLTREGLLRSIDWDSLHIDTVLQADDGMHALQVIREYRPEIILSDIRMPGLNGIELAQKVLELLPDTNIIFMSGYSDKEYLKAAIRLKAISYVEKPIDRTEIEQAVREAVTNIETRQNYEKTHSIHLKEQSSQLAHLLTLSSTTAAEIQDLTKALQLSLTQQTYITTLILQLLDQDAESLSEQLSGMMEEFTTRISSLHMQQLHTYKSEQHLIIHLYADKKPDESAILKCTSWLHEQLSRFCRFFIAAGRTVHGPEQVYKSYNHAVILLQSGFFHDYNAILTEQPARTDSALIEDQLAAFSLALTQKNADEALHILQIVYENLRNCQTLLPSQVKDIYYKYFMQIQNELIANQIVSSTLVSPEESIWDTIAGCNTLSDLHELLCHRLDELFSQLEETLTKSPVVYQIKDFISKNYARDSLSVKDISDYIHRSSSYVCTMFKSETGQTLNQYITEYRINMAIQLMNDPRLKITDISSMVGYMDGNYFAKIFKKYIGLTPSEYREKILA